MLTGGGGGWHLRVPKDRQPMPSPIPPFLIDFAMLYKTRKRMRKKSY